MTDDVRTLRRANTLLRIGVVATVFSLCCTLGFVAAGDSFAALISAGTAGFCLIAPVVVCCSPVMNAANRVGTERREHEDDEERQRQERQKQESQKFDIESGRSTIFGRGVAVVHPQAESLIDRIIRLNEEGRSSYAILGMTPEASTNDIEKAYKKLCLRTHPDKHPGDPSAVAAFQIVGEAYEVLAGKNRER